MTPKIEKKPKRDKRPIPEVRPKASVRKSRSDTVALSARRPLQGRSIDRFERILAATEELLQSANIEDISFYDIARHAKISPASVNYLFPTMSTLRIELSKRYNRLSTDHTIETQRTLARMRNLSWQDWIYVMGKHARDEFNSNRHFCEVMLGPQLHRESRRVTTESNDRVGRSLLESFRQVFIIPEIPGLAHKFALMAEIADALWSRAYILNGRIDDDSFEESIRVQVAYLRSILPEILPVVHDVKLLDESRRAVPRE